MINRRFRRLLLLVAGYVYFMQAYAANKHIATCYTGDSLGGVEIFADQNNFIMEIYSQEESQPPQVFRTNGGALKELSYDVDNVISKLNKGLSMVILMSQKSSYSFGGSLSDAALLNISLKDEPGNKTTRLAANGNVYTLSCSKVEN